MAEETTAGGAGPALVKAKAEIRGLDDFATWRAARAVGDRDLNTLAVRADPLAGTDGLAPGMTVRIESQGR